MTHAAQLRALLKAQAMVIAPGAYDGITAKLIQQAGFPAVYMTGAGTAASYGYPDFGLVTLTEMVANAARIVRAADLPVIADADTGYGNELNVARTIQEHERAGTSGVHIEDQVSPKKCGHLDDKEIVTREEWLAKIRAAAATRRDPDFLVIARTDARAVAGFDEALARSNLALANGADMVFFEAAQTLDEVASIPKLVNGPCLLNVVRGGKTPEVNLLDAEKMGYRMAIVPGLLMKAFIGIGDEMLAELKRTHVYPKTSGDPTVRQVFNRFGADEWDELRTRFRDDVSKIKAAE